MKENEIISIIIPIYNVESYLDKCIESVVNQTYSNIEIILVDDGSPDGCPIICDNWKEKDKRIKVYHKENGGLSDARNFGIDHCNGNYIVFVDSDDYIEENMVETLFKTIKEDKSDMAICDFYITKNNKDIKQKYPEERFIVSKNKFDYLYNEYFFVTVVAWNKIYKRDLFKNIRYPYKKIHEDEFVICDLLDSAEKISFVLKPLYHYVQRSNSIMGQISLKRFDIIDALDTRVEFFEKIHDVKNKNETQKDQFFKLLGLLTRTYNSKKDFFDDEFIQKKLLKLTELANTIKKFNNLSLLEMLKVRFILVNPILYIKLVKAIRTITIVKH